MFRRQTRRSIQCITARRRFSAGRLVEACAGAQEGTGWRGDYHRLFRRLDHGGRGAANVQDCYVSQVYKWWYEAFPFAKINVINAGVGGTSSYLGVHRVDAELLAHKPDLVFMGLQ